MRCAAALGVVLLPLGVLPAAGQVDPAPSAAVEAAPDPPGPRETTLQFDAAYEYLTNGYGPWRSAGLTIRTGAGPRSGFHGGVRESVRFARLDHEIVGGVRRPLASALTGSAEIEVSPTHHVAPRVGLIGQLDLEVGDGWIAQTRLQHRRYASASVTMGSLATERYWGRYRAAYTLYVAHLHQAETALAHRVSGDMYYGRLSNSIGIGLSTGEELEHVQPAGVLRTPVRSVSLAGRQWLTSDWFVAYDTVLHRQGALYQRRRLGVSLGRRL